ncbi:hypothetical protein [Marmoricola sp. URHB0036]|nr:hypothetical protein [Marmoricola sp. URHB0036]
MSDEYANGSDAYAFGQMIVHAILGALVGLALAWVVSTVAARFSSKAA